MMTTALRDEADDHPCSLIYKCVWKLAMFGKKTLASLALGLVLWVGLVTALTFAPLDRGESNAGIFALLGTISSDVNEEGERVFTPNRLSF